VDLGDFLNEDEIRHYERFLGTGSLTIFVHPDPGQNWRWTATTVATGQPQAFRYAAIAGVQELPTRDDLLVPVGRGPDAASSCQELALAVQWSWDVCGYYSRLGLHWTATRRDIREALARLRATMGAGKERLIYAASQLLNRKVRADYDRMPLGGTFLGDKDVQDQIKRAAHQAASAMAARGFSHVTPEDVLGQWGFTVNRPGGPRGEEAGPEAPPPAPPPYTGRILEMTARWQNHWTWYREPDLFDTFGMRTEELEEWQLLLVREFTSRGMHVHFAVGLSSSRTFRVVPAPNPKTLVMLLGEGGPSPELARAAVDMWGLATEMRRRGDRNATIPAGDRAG
jgi:hypothetical protein